jgi:UDP-N-acetylglucosamine transferase subunit ALG13
VIFVTTGTQLPFVRLIDAVDALAADLDEEVIAQVGPDTTPRANIETHATLPPARFAELFRSARLVISHAGIGSILSAKRYGRPLIVVPRRLKFGEHRNDHQLATAAEVEAIPGIHVVWDPADLRRVLSAGTLEAPQDSPSPTAHTLIERVRDFVDNGC